MYDPILAKSFSRYDRKRLGCTGLVLIVIIAFSLCSSFDPHRHISPIIGDAVNLKFPSHFVGDMFVMNDAGGNSFNRTVARAPNVHAMAKPPKTSQQRPDSTRVQITLMPSKHFHRSPEDLVGPPCETSGKSANYCEIEGDVRVDPNSSTVFVVGPKRRNRSWIMQPYPRKHISNVKNWTVTSVANDDSRAPKCTRAYHLPAILFSIGGFTGNHFHDFADLILPLFSTTSHFRKDILFLASDYKPWWVSKFRGLLNRLTGHEIVDIEKETGQVHCYGKMILGLRFYRELIISPPPDRASDGARMPEFRRFLRETYSLRVAKRSKRGGPNRTRLPRMMIVSRKRTRVMTNEDEVARAAGKLGYEVVSAEARLSTNLTIFAQLVNSCDVLMGVHGAGLTDMLFLPDDAVVIQVVPFGGIDVFARLDFGNPAPGMKLKYLEYKIRINESSLGQQYSADHPVVRDPLSVHKKGWDEISAVYLKNQNVTIDVHRFRGTLAKALKLLRH